MVLKSFSSRESEHPELGTIDRSDHMRQNVCRCLNRMFLCMKSSTLSIFIYKVFMKYHLSSGNGDPFHERQTFVGNAFELAKARAILYKNRVLVSILPKTYLGNIRQIKTNSFDSKVKDTREIKE
uniref:Uncharacterized protein n=1 Tax=Cacopsylla melanoneura TaxID=428564 RepID=A0A8D8UQF5_9HEMI